MHDIFYFTDVHGVRPLFDNVMNYCREQDPEATIIFGGDAIDRGTDGYAIMKELLDNPYVIYLKGNHEDMFCKAARTIEEKFNFKNADKERIHKVLNACRHFDYKYAAIQDSLNNGGLDTLTDWILDGMPIELIERIENLPLTFSYEQFDFCHAAGIYKTFKRAADAEYEGKKVNKYVEESLLWSRSALRNEWAPNRIAVFGHTPIQYVLRDLDVNWPKERGIQPVHYVPYECGEKIAMDTGAIFTNRIFVLNVLTMKAQGFTSEEKIECIKV